MNNQYFTRFHQAFFLLICWLVLSVGAQAQTGITWTSQTSAADNDWQSVAYGNGLFVAVAFNGTVMTSPNGINWTSRTAASSNQWYTITYGNGLFVALSANGTGNRVMTSPDGINWTARTSAADNFWRSITYGTVSGNGLFVAVASSGSGNRVMTSPDGITWTIRNSAANNFWTSVTYGNGLFVAVAANSTSNGVMTSPNGIAWTSRTSAADRTWNSVTYGNGRFVAVAGSSTGSGNRVMTSTDGVTWTSQAASLDTDWSSVTYGNGLFVAVAFNGSANGVMTSTDGVTWTTRTSPTDNAWLSVIYGNGLFVAVSSAGGVMTSGATPLPVNLVSFTAQAQPDQTVRLKWTTSLETNNKGFLIERSKDLTTFETVGQVSELAPNSEARKDYTLTDQTPYVGTSYYRLSQTDLSGHVNRFPAVSVVLKAEGYGVFPNPVVSGTSFSLRLDEPQTATISLTNTQGKALPFQKMGIQSGNLLVRPNGSLPAGIYLLTVEERGQTRQHRLIVQ